MKQCLRCGNFCIGASIFCQSCQSSLLNRFEQEPYQTKPVSCPETKVLSATKMIQDSDSIDSGPLAARPLPWVRRRAALRRMRRILIALVLLVVIVLIIDSILVLLVFTHPIIRRGDAFPLLTPTLSIVYLGQTIQLHLSHFPQLQLSQSFPGVS